MVDRFPTSLQVRLSRAGGSLGRLVSQAGHQLSLLEQVRACFPSPLDRHLIGAERRSGELQLVMDSAAWTARARYMSGELKRRLARELNPPPQRISVRAGHVGREAAIPDRAATRGQRRGKRSLSGNSREHIREVARYLDDPELREALERLAREGE
ncbi:DciA family protein [Gammaproteobacteria bacterium AB-CW1]|uniref:DciA family protein n=1 Tax=Natronospira elongata TaxID=3110268 RepID=A0AAP6JE72_9GAMM|nr:DciA family protein [Gammaproteobacteria bacterium AB-CW1]